MSGTEPDRDVTERLERFSRTRDQRDLWPDLRESAAAAARKDIERVVRAVLADERRVVLDGSGKDALYALTVAGFTTGVGPLLGRWIEDGRVQAPPAVADVFALQLDHGRRRAARIQQGLLPALDALLARRIVPVVIKGLHTALAYSEEAGVRPMSDVDMVVLPEEVGDAELALESAGFRPRPRTEKHKRDWVSVDVDPRVFSVERYDARSRWHVELHQSFNRSFPNGIEARLDPERHHVESLHVGSRVLRAPMQPLLTLVLACQLSSELNLMRLMRLIDLVRVIRADRARGVMDWNDLLAAMHRTGTARFTYPALALVEDLAPGTLDPRVLAAARDASSRVVRDTVKRLVPSGGFTEHASLATMLMWADGPLGLVGSAARMLARNALPTGPTMERWRVFARRALAGRFSFSAPDERGGGAKD